MRLPVPFVAAMLCGALAAAAAAQGPCFELDLGTDLGLHDESTSPGLALGFPFPFHGTSYTSICVATNGYIILGPTTTIASDYTPTAAELLASPQPRICPLWTDLDPDPVGSGHVWFRAIPAIGQQTARAIITWAGVYEFFTTNPIEMQLELDANGLITVTYGGQSPTQGLPMVIGLSPGGGIPANPVSLATRPIAIAQDNFAEELPAGPSYTNLKLQWIPTSPGYLVVDAPCAANVLPTAAAVEPAGVGCPVRSKPTIYELFSMSHPVDVSGTDLTFLPDGQGGYTVVNGIAGPFFTGLTNNLHAGDDTVHPLALPFAFPHGHGTVNAINVSANGFLGLGWNHPGAGCCNGNTIELLAGESRIAAWWGDLNPLAGGAVYADYDASTGEYVVTWDHVPEYSTATPNTCQIALLPSGVFKIRLPAVARSSGYFNFLLGYSYGHGARDPGGTDFSAGTHPGTGPLSWIGPLSQSAAYGVLPKIGTTFPIDIAGISAAPQGNAVLLLVGLAELDPGIDLGTIGAPGCNAYLLPSASDFQFLNLVGGAPTTVFAISIPSSPSLTGLHVTSQVVSDDVDANAFGWKFSNALRWTIGI